MALTGAQVRGKIKNIAKSNRADARILMRIYMMERFLERVANSPYSENFIIKGRYIGHVHDRHFYALNNGYRYIYP